MRRSTRTGAPQPTDRDLGLAQLLHHLDERVDQLRLRAAAASRARSLARPCPTRSTMPARIFVPPRSIPIARPSATSAGTLTRRMAPDDKPYRVYRGGRTKGKVPAVPRNGRATPPRRLAPPRGAAAVPAPPAAARRVAPGRRSCSLGLVALLVLVVDLGGRSATSPSRAASAQANKRLPADARARRSRRATASCSATPTTILLLGLDSSTAAARSGDRHSDSIMIVRTDPSHHTARLPLDSARPARARARRSGTTKINAAYQFGGPALAIKTIEAFTGIAINHIVIVELRQLQAADRRRGRNHGRRPRADPLEPLRLPLRDAGPLPAVEGLALPPGRAAHERRAGADLLPHPREPAQPSRERPHPRGAPAGGRAGGGVASCSPSRHSSRSPSTAAR